MKRNFLWIIGVMLSCCFAMTAVAACGDEDDESLANGQSEVCIVGLLPTDIAPYANLEMTYYDVQGMEKHLVVRHGESSDALPSYAKEGLLLLQLTGGLTIDYSKNVVRTVRFVAPAGTKITCKYRVVLNGEQPSTFPQKAYTPVAMVTGKRNNGEILITQGTTQLSQKALSSVEAFKSWLTAVQNRGESLSYVVAD